MLQQAVAAAMVFHAELLKYSAQGLQGKSATMRDVTLNKPEAKKDE